MAPQLPEFNIEIGDKKMDDLMHDGFIANFLLGRENPLIELKTRQGKSIALLSIQSFNTLIELMKTKSSDEQLYD